MTRRMSRFSRISPPFLIAGRNPVISGHAIEIFQTPPLCALRSFLRLGRDRFFIGVRILFPIRPHRGESLTGIRVCRDIFRRIERRAFRSVSGNGDVPLFRLRQRFERALVNRGARRFPYGARGRLPGVRTHARFGSRVVLVRFGVSGRRALTQAHRCRAPFVLRRENVPMTRSLRVAEENSHVSRPILRGRTARFRKAAVRILANRAFPV